MNLQMSFEPAISEIIKWTNDNSGFLSLLIFIIPLLGSFLFWLLRKTYKKREAAKIENPKILKEENLIKITEKKLPYDILDHIDLDNPLDFVKETLGSPQKIYDSIPSAFNDDEIKTTVWFYNFSNAQLCIESDDDKKVSVITLQVWDEEEPFELPVLGTFKNLTMGDVMDESGFDQNHDNLVHFSSMRDGYILLECYFGRLGMYRTYTFGCYDCHEVHDYELIDNKLTSRTGEIFDGRSLKINFISISHQEGRGHPIA